MNEIDYEYMKEEYSEEMLNLCWISEMLDNEDLEIKTLRHSFVNIMQTLIEKRDKAGRSEAWRNYNIAITELENSCIRAIKGIYSK